MVKLVRKDNGKTIELVKKKKKATSKKPATKKTTPKKDAPRPLELKSKMQIIIDRKTKNPLRKRKRGLC